MALKVNPVNRKKLMEKARYWFNALDAINTVMSLDHYFMDTDPGKQQFRRMQGFREWVITAYALLEQNHSLLIQRYIREISWVMGKLELDPVIQTMRVGEWQVPDEPVPAHTPAYKDPWSSWLVEA